MKPSGLIAGGLMLLSLPAAAVPPSADDARAALALSRAAIGRQLDDFHFVDSERRPVALSEFRGKPLVINLIYTACVHTCPVIAETLYRHARAARDSLGKDSFAIVSIGFDTANDTPERMRAFARQQGLDLDNWRFLSADSETMSRLTQALGFTLYPSAQGFDHLAQLTLLDGEGRVYRQIYGDYFEAPFLVEPLKDLVFGRHADLSSFDGLVNRLKLFCTIYDPSAGRYRFDYSIFIGIAMGLSVLAVLGTILARAFWREWRQRGTAAPTG